MLAKDSRNVAGQHPAQSDRCHIRVRFGCPPVELDYCDDRAVASRFAASATSVGAIVTIDDDGRPDLPPLPCRQLWA